MKEIDAPSRIKGLTLSSLEISLVSTGPTARAEYFLLNEESMPCAMLTVGGQEWSERAQKALSEFITVIEEEAAGKVFRMTDAPEKKEIEESPELPPQF